MSFTESRHFPFLDSMPASSNESSNAFLCFNRTAIHKCPFAGRNTAELRGQLAAIGFAEWRRSLLGGESAAPELTS